MDLVSELVVIRSQIEVISSDDPDTPMATSGRQLRLVTRELQDQVMKARLQPIGVVTGRLRRLARDVGAELGKRVQVALEGEDIAVDRAVNEALRDPLLHLVRNCVDHGLESATERAAVGKPAVGSLRVAVRHSHGRVYVDVSDDGRGMDPVALARRAVRIGLISEDRADRLSEREALDLVFLPGFTTADQVTNVSGRGVGMDVVRSNLQRIGGSIEIRSTIGVGTSFRLNVPLTLAIMPVLTVWCGGQRYAVPQVSVREIRRVRGDDVEQAPDDIEGALIYRIRGHLLPSVDLAALLKVPPDHEADQLLVLLESDQRQFAVLVAAVGDTTDVVAKPLPRSVGGVSAFAGVSIYGDGCPVLILDVDWIANISGITVSGGQAEPTPATAVREDTVLLLLACAEDGGQLVLPLDRVLRLENFDQDQVERLGDLDVVQYRDDILPLVRVRDVLPERRASPRDLPARPQTSTLATVVCASQVGAVGIVVGGIEDIVKTSDAARRPASRAGVLSCLVVADRVAELLDIDALAALAGVRRTS